MTTTTAPPPATWPDGTPVCILDEEGVLLLRTIIVGQPILSALGEWSLTLEGGRTINVEHIRLDEDNLDDSPVAACFQTQGYDLVCIGPRADLPATDFDPAEVETSEVRKTTDISPEQEAKSQDLAEAVTKPTQTVARDLVQSEIDSIVKKDQVLRRLALDIQNDEARAVTMQQELNEFRGNIKEKHLRLVQMSIAEPQQEIPGIRGAEDLNAPKRPEPAESPEDAAKRRELASELNWTEEALENCVYHVDHLQWTDDPKAIPVLHEEAQHLLAFGKTWVATDEHDADDGVTEGERVFICVPLHDLKTWKAEHAERLGPPIDVASDTRFSTHHREHGNYCGRSVKVGRKKLVVGPESERLHIVVPVEKPF